MSRVPWGFVLYGLGFAAGWLLPPDLLWAVMVWYGSALGVGLLLMMLTHGDADEK